MITDDKQIGIDDLLKLRGADREAKAYAFLYAAFKRTEVSSNPVRDALDCLVPFIAPYTNEISGHQVTAEGIRDYLKERVGFHLPLYAVEQIFGSLQQHGYVDYIKATRTFIAKTSASNFHVAKREIESDYDGIARDLEAYATELGFVIPPPAGGWGEALIQFMRQSGEKPAPKLAPVKKVVMDPARVQEAIVGAFIRKLSETSPNKFRGLINIFMGTLIEDFISSVSELGVIGKGKPVDVFYDTAVIMRQLGCSGTLLRVATEELTQYLHDIGCNVYYFSGNEVEVSNIIDTILFVKDSGREVEGETAEALSLGQITTTDLRLLQNAMPERLARDNIFPAGELERIEKNAERWQIDERGFSEYLLRAALNSGRAYGAQNRTNDASYLGHIMRLRKGARGRDFADSGNVFVTSNKFLAYASRKYLVEQKLISFKDCPPILSVGQIATIAWLMKDHAISEEKAGRELLLNCYAAISPDADWFKYFREGIEKVVGSVEDFAKDGQNALALQAARRIAGEESFGHPMVVRELNMAEILARAQEEAARERTAWEDRIKAEEEGAKSELELQAEQYQAKQIDIVRDAEVARRKAVHQAQIAAREAILLEVAQQKLATASRRADLLGLPSKFFLY